MSMTHFKVMPCISKLVTELQQHKGGLHTTRRPSDLSCAKFDLISDALSRRVYIPQIISYYLNILWSTIRLLSTKPCKFDVGLRHNLLLFSGLRHFASPTKNFVSRVNLPKGALNRSDYHFGVESMFCWFNLCGLQAHIEVGFLHHNYIFDVII